MLFRAGRCLLIILSFTSAAIGAAEIDMNPGMWEWSAQMDMPGMPGKAPAAVHRACITEQDLVPRNSNPNSDCEVSDVVKERGSVTWSMTCTTPQGALTSTGRMTYSGDTAQGETVMQSQGMQMVAKMTGRRVGPCN